MANPYSGSAQIHLQPYPGEFFANLAERGAQRDEKFDDLMSKVATTHIPVKPGTDTDEQQAFETQVKGSLATVADQLAKNQIGAREAHRSVMNTYNQLINDPGTIKRVQSKELFDQQLKGVDMLAQAGKLLPEERANYLQSALTHSSTKDGLWNKSQNPYDDPTNDIDTFLKSLADSEIKAGRKGVSPERLQEFAEQNKESFYKSHPNARFTDVNDVYNRFMSTGYKQLSDLPMYKSDEDGVNGPRRTAQPKEEKDDSYIARPTPGLTYDVNPEIKSTVDLQNKIEGYDNTIAELSRQVFDLPDESQESYKAAFSSGAQYIKKSDGTVYLTSDYVSNGNPTPVTEQYNDEVGSVLNKAQAEKEILESDRVQINKRAAESIQSGMYNALVKKGLYDPITGAYTLNYKDFADQMAAEKARLIAKEEETSPDFIWQEDDIKRINREVTEYAQKLDPTYGKLVKAQNKATEAFYNKHSVTPTGFLFSNEENKLDKTWSSILDKEIKNQGAVILDDKGNAIDTKKDPNALAKILGGDIEFTSWYPAYGNKGIVVQFNSVTKEKGKSPQRSTPMLLDLSGPLEQQFYDEHGITNGSNFDAIEHLVKGKMGDTPGRRSAKINIDGNDYNIRNTGKDNLTTYIGFTNPTTGKYQELNIGEYDSKTTANKLQRIIQSNSNYNVDVTVEGIKAVEGGKNIQNLSGSNAFGYYQINPSYFPEIAASYGVSKPADILKLTPQQQKSFAADIIEENRPNATMLYNNYKSEFSDFSKSDYDLMTYYLGYDGVRKWLKTASEDSVAAADATIPWYDAKKNVGLMQYLGTARTGISEERKRIKAEIDGNR